MALTPPGNKYLDLVKNNEAVLGTQIPSVAAAVVLGYIDKAINFTADPLLSALIVYAVVNVISLVWARAQVWSRKSVVQVAITGEIPPPP